MLKYEKNRLMLSWFSNLPRRTTTRLNHTRKRFVIHRFLNTGHFLSYTERNNWCHALERDQCLAIVAVQIVELIKSSNKFSKFMRAAHSNLQRQNTVYSHKKYVTLQHLLLMRLRVDTRWAEGGKLKLKRWTP